MLSQICQHYELEHYLNKDTKLNKYLCDIFIKCKKSFMKDSKDEIGSSKTLWDLSVIDYEINADWFKSELISSPIVLDDGLYKETTDRHKVIFVNDLYRNKIYQDFFIKMENTMKLTSNEALQLIQKEQGKKEYNERWIKHSICVGNVAYVIAKALNLDEEFAKTLGYIHDIGKRFEYKEDGVFPHAIKGYEYIKSLGYDEEYAGICIKHSFLNNDIDCISNDRDETDKQNPNYNFVKEYIRGEYSIYEKIINLLDLMCTTKVLTVDKRMMDLLLRRGVFAKTHYHIEETLKLKEYFDDLFGYNLYDLFPEIKDNL